MFKRMKLTILAATALAATALATPALASEPSKSDKVVIGTSIYAGWMPWYQIKDSGLMDQVNKEFGTNVQIRTYGTYDASFADYTGRALQGVTLTNMDAILSPASAGIKSLALINGDSSDGNDAVIAASDMSCSDLKGKDVHLMVGTVSQYVLNGYLSTCGLTDFDVNMVNVTDAEIETIFLQNENPSLVVVTWNPVVQNIMNTPNAVKLFDSSQIEDEIIDTMYVNADLHPDVYRAITEAWYRAMKVMTTRGKAQKEMVRDMASAAELTGSELQKQFETTKFYPTREVAKTFTESDKLKDVMAKVVDFIDTKEMLEDSVKSTIGIQFPDGSVLGNADNVKIVFTVDYL
jgi:NitT/TauT family transport system substrate-binding protein